MLDSILADAVSLGIMAPVAFAVVMEQYDEIIDGLGLWRDLAEDDAGAMVRSAAVGCQLHKTRLVEIHI